MLRRRGDHRDLQQIQVFFLVDRSNAAAGELFSASAGSLMRSEEGKSARCFPASYETGFFQPGDSSANAGVIGGDVALEVAPPVFIEDFARGGDDGPIGFSLR